MSLLAPRWREQVQGAAGWVAETFDGLSASFTGIFTREHNADGTHKDITVDSLKIGGDPVTTLQSYTPTIASVDNTATKTAVVSFVVPGGEMKKGDVIDVIVIAKTKQNTSSGQNVTFEAAWGTATATMAVQSMQDSGDEGVSFWSFSLIHESTSLWCGVGVADSTSSNSFNDVRAVEMTGANFAASQSVEIRLTLATAHASFYFRPQAAFVTRRKLTAS